MTGSAVAEPRDFGHVDECLIIQSVGAAELQHAMADGAGAVVDELRREHKRQETERGQLCSFLASP